MEVNFCPIWLLQRLKVPDAFQTHAAFFISALASVLLMPLVRTVPHVCLVKTLLGIPCPGCGVLHGMAALYRLDFVMAWKSNPSAIGIALLFLFQIVMRPVAIVSLKAGRNVAAVSRFVSDAVLAWVLISWVLRITFGGLYGGNFLLQM